MDLRSLITRLDNIASMNEAADPQLYADAQKMMANLEKAAQYTGDDEIVRQRMGLPPKLPPIEQWDGKMPQPIGKPDWFSRLTTFGKSTDDQAAAVKQNSAISTSRQFITTNLAKLKELVDKLKATQASSQPAAVKESIAKSLMESFGYYYEDFNDSATDLIRKRAAANTPSSALSDFGSVGAARAERQAAQAAEKAAAEKAAQAAAGSAVNQAATKAGVSAAEKAAATGGTTALKAGGKLLGKLAPGVGLAFGAKDAYDRYKQGDYLGAGIAGASGIASLVPGIGTAAALGLDAANLARDIKGSSTPAAGAGGKPAAGARDAMPFGQAFAAARKAGEKTFMWKGKEYTTQLATESENMASLQKRLALIETKGKIRDQLANEYVFDDQGNLYEMDGTEVTDQLTLEVIWESVADKDVTLDENWLTSLGKGAWNFAKGLGSAGAAPAYKAALKTGGATKAGAQVAKKIVQNPVKAGLGAAAVGGLAGAALPGTPAQAAQGGKPPAGSKPAATADTPAAPAAPETPAAPTGPTPEQSDLIKQIQAVMAQMADIEEQPVIDALGDAQKTIDAVSAAPAAGQGGKPAPAPASYDSFGNPTTAGSKAATTADYAEKRTPAEVKASQDLGNFAG